MNAFSLLYSKKLLAKLFFFLYLVSLLLHGVGNLLAFVAALFVTSVCQLLSVRGRKD